MQKTRRLLLKGSFSAGAIGLAISAGMLTPKVVLAGWPRAAFKAKNTNIALEAVYGISKAIESDNIILKVPKYLGEIDPYKVPISVISKIANTEVISIIVPSNNTPLSANFILGATTKGHVSTRISMPVPHYAISAMRADLFLSTRFQSEVIAVVKAGGKLYRTTKSVEINVFI